jgi:hypothetical protein
MQQLADLLFHSRHELHRDGVEGARGNEQRALGRIVYTDAGDRRWDL